MKNSSIEESDRLFFSIDDSVQCIGPQESSQVVGLLGVKNSSKSIHREGDEDTFSLKNYTVWKTPIGQGSFSDVYKGFHKADKRTVAIKCLRIGAKTNMNRIHFETNIMKDLDHHNIVKLYEVIEVVSDGKIYMVMEYCSGGTLEKYIENNSLPERQIHHFIKNLADGLRYLRSKNILHRDLKPHNLLISEDNILKISDFGLSTLLDNNHMTDTLCGSPLYMAPEVITNNIYGVKSDLWSVGIILYQLLYHKHPYKFRNIWELINEMNNTVIDYPQKQVSQNCINLMRGLLVTDNNKRLCWGEFFSHPWLTQAEFVTDSYKISQPVNIKDTKRKTGLVSDYMINNYNPGSYDQVAHSEPLPQVRWLDNSIPNSAAVHASIVTSKYRVHDYSAPISIPQKTDKYVDPSFSLMNFITTPIRQFFTHK